MNRRPDPTQWSMNVTKDELFDVKNEFEHNPTRMGEAIILLRRTVGESADINRRLFEERDSLKKDKDALVAKIRDQDAHSLSREESLTVAKDELRRSGELIQSLQAKLTHTQEQLAEVQAARIDELKAHEEYARKGGERIAHMEMDLRRLELTARYLTKLSEENLELQAKANSRLLFSRVRAVWAERWQRRANRPDPTRRDSGGE